MGSQQSKLPGDRCSLTLLFVGSGFSFKKKCSDITVAKTTDLKLAPINCLEECRVGRRPRIDGAHRPSVPPQRFADFLGPLEQWDFSFGCRKRRKIPQVGRTRHLGSAFEIDHPFTQDAPSLFTIALCAAVRTGLLFP